MAAHEPTRPLIVVLVHGTFAQHAKWSRSDSGFVKALSGALGSTTRFEVFNWSGANSHTARLQAGRELGAFLRSSIASRPDYRCVVIAHSHAGNIALYAIQDEDVRYKISAIVCLSTPFLNCRVRELWTTNARALIMAVLVCIASVLFGMLLRLSEPWVKPLDQTFSRLLDWGVPAPLLMIIAFGCVVLPLIYVVTDVFPFLFGWIVNGINRWFLEHATVRVSRLNPAISDAPPILCLRFNGDEARLWLLGLPTIAELPNATKALLAGFVSTWLGVVWIGGGLFIQRFLPGLGLFWAVSLFLVPLLLALALLALPIITITASIMLRGHRLAFGEHLLDNVVMRTYVEPTPAKVSPPAELMELELSERWYKRPVFRHSFIYQDPRTPGIIAAWIRSKLRT